MAPAIKILIVEHDLHDIELIEHELTKGEIHYISEIVQSEKSYRAALNNFAPDIILSDYTFPSFDGPAAFKIKEQITPETPFIIISGTIGEENSIELIKSGVTDFLLKDKIFALNIKLVRALRQAKEASEKRLTEASLKESEARLAASQALSNIGSWQTELSDLSVVWSQETFRIFDVDPGIFHPTHQRFLDFITPEDREKVKTAFDTSTRNHEEVNTITHAIITGKGVVKNVEERWRIVYDDKGNPLRAIGTCQDITESRKNELRIKASEERFRTLFEQTLAGFYQSREDGVIINCNKAFATMLGYASREALINTNAKELYFSVSDRNDFMENIIKKKKLNNHEGILKRKDGTALYFLENIIEHTNPSIGEAYFDGILIDITERKKSEREIGWMINNTEESFILLNNKLEITSFNEQARLLYSKYFLKSLQRGNSILDYAQPERLDTVKDIYKKVLAGNEMTDEILIALPDASFKNFALKYKPAKDENGNAVGAFVSAIDITDKRKAEKQKEFEGRDKEALINTTSDLIWSVTTDFRLIAANRAFYHSLKNSVNIDVKPGDKLILENNYPAEFLSLWKELYGKALAGESFIEEIYSSAGDGYEESWAESRFSPIYDGDIITGIACYSRDTTAAKKTQNRLLETNKKLETAQQIAKMGYWEQDMNSNTLFWSDEVYKIWGVSPENFQPDFINFFNSIHPDDRARFNEAQKATFAGEADLDVEHRIILPDETVKCVHEKGELIYDEGKKVFRFEGTVQDITERKNAQEAVHAVLRDKNIILESIDEAFFAVDKNFIVTYWNNRAEKMLGKSIGDMLGRNLWDILPETVGANSFKHFSDALQSNKVIRFENFDAPRKRWHEIGAYPSPNGLSVYFKNISERKLSESRMKELNAHLEGKAKELAISNAELEQFAYVASHDLQEPLRMVTSFLGLLEKKYAEKFDEKGKTYISFAVDGAKHMRRIILDLLEYSKVGGLEQEPEAVDLNELVEDIRRLFKKELRGNEAFIHSRVLPVIFTYRTPLVQVFQNLVSNALKYRRKNIAPKIHINLEEQEDFWEFSVTDNGIGIDPEYFDKIFIIFQRLHHKDVFSGTGLGLAITKKLIDNRGGKIWVKSLPGKGSSFYFTLPKNEPHVIHPPLQIAL